MESSYAHGTSLVPLLGGTIGANLEATTARFPDREVLVSRHQSLRYTYTTFSEEVDLVARGLLARGVEVGDRVGIWSPNRAEWAVVQYATAKVGAILVTVNPAYRSAELAFVLRQSGMRTVVAASGFRGADYVAMIDAARADAPALAEVVILDDDSYQALRSDGQRVTAGALERREAVLDADQPINIQYTSGTTGFPKGATLSHHNILNNGFFVGEGCRYTEEDRICVPVPYYHCFGMVMGNLAATTHGACVVLPAEGFEGAAVLEAVSAERCTSLYGVPTMFIAELAEPAFATADLTTLRTGIMAGSPCPVEVMRQVVEKMGMEEVTICYGMTETSPVSTQTSPDDSLEQRTGTVGRAHPHVEVKVIDPATGLAVPRGETGELCTRGYSVMLGYWDEPERTAEVLDRAGWMHTGDLATMDPAGYVNIVGRTKDMIIRGGENVYPREVEELLYTHPAIADVQVIGVPDPRYGEVVMAWVQLRPGEELDAETLVGWCRERMAHFKVPSHVRFVEGFPMTVTGKVQKYKMREQAIAELGLEAIAAERTA
jgi:fatty-acyl-CoA synthase